MTKYFVKVSCKTGKISSSIIEIDKQESEVSADDLEKAINSVFKNYDVIETITTL